MNKSIGRKTIFMIAVVGIVMLAIIIMNYFALVTIEEYNNIIAEDIHAYEAVIRADDAAEMANMEAKLEDILGTSQRKIHGTVIFDGVLVVFALVLLVTIQMGITRTIAKPAQKTINQLNDIVGKMDAGKGDLTQRVKIRSKDEIGQLAAGINGFIDTLQKLMQSLTVNAEKMNASSEEIAQNVNESNKDALNVSSAMQEMAASMEEISATLHQISADSTGVLERVQNISENANQGADTIGEIKNRAVEMQKSTVESKESAIAMLSRISEQLEEAVQESRNVDKINELTSNILNIASQTNLIALNASIEAARAGEAGKGFAVVADEIRHLADDSRDTANSIQQISKLVTDAVELLSTNAGDMIKFMGNDVMNDYDGFVKIVNQYESDADTMNGILTDFAQKATAMAEIMDNVNQGITDINTTVEESAKAVTSVAEDTSNLVNALAQIQDDAVSGQEVAAALQAEVSRFEKV